MHRAGLTDYESVIEKGREDAIDAKRDKRMPFDKSDKPPDHCKCSDKRTYESYAQEKKFRRR